MRAAVRRKLTSWGYLDMGNNSHAVVDVPPDSELVERELRTYMLNGTMPEELEATPPDNPPLKA